MLSIVSSVAGAATWSVAEYLIHRFVGHGPKRKRAEGLARVSLSGLAAEFNAEHLAHHADPSYFAPTSRKVAAAGLALGAAGAGLSLVLGRRVAAAYVLGFGASYAAYEILHRRIHTHPPRGPYGRWMRRHHLHHHHRSPRDNHGVTNPFWDRAFGTLVPVERIRVPRHMPPAWLVDPATGAVRSEYAGEYELVGGRAGEKPCTSPSTSTST